MVFLLQCRKQDRLTTIPSEIVFGTKANLLVQNYDTVLIGGYHNKIYLDLDVNNDGENDVRFGSEIWGSPNLGQNPKSTISPLHNNLFLSGITKDDTTFLNIIQNTETSSGNAVKVYSYYRFSCIRISIDDSIYTLSPGQFKLVSKSVDETLKKTDYFKSEPFILADNYPISYSTPVISNDTTYYKQSTTNKSCDYFPADKIGYIGFKLIHQDTEKLGWLKISINNNYKISILESVIQQ